MKFIVNCKHCLNSVKGYKGQVYNVRDLKNIPKRPHTVCKICKKWINIDKNVFLAHINQFQKDQKKKNSRKTYDQISKILERYKVLKLLQKGYYAGEIAQKVNFSNKKISQIVNWVKTKELVLQLDRTPKIPKYYNLTEKGKIFLDQGKISKKNIEKYKNEKKEEKLKPEWVKDIRVHKLKLFNYLNYRPHWLNGITYKIPTIRPGFTIYRYKMNNWDKFIITFNYKDFGGIEKVEITPNKVIYNFNRTKLDSIVKYENGYKGLLNYLDNRLEDCKKCRKFLIDSNFDIDQGDPKLSQKYSIAIESDGDPGEIGSLGQFIQITLNGSQWEFDNSPKRKKGGDEETDDPKKIKSYFDLGPKVDNMGSEISEMKNAISEMNNSIKDMANAINGMAQAITKGINPPGPPGPIKDIDNSENLYK